MGKGAKNYLDDFLFAALLTALCNGQVEIFLQICAEINFPVSLDKTFWGCQILMFLGFLLNTKEETILIPIEKIEKNKGPTSGSLQQKKDYHPQVPTDDRFNEFYL